MSRTGAVKHLEAVFPTVGLYASEMRRWTIRSKDAGERKKLKESIEETLKPENDEIEGFLDVVESTRDWFATPLLGGTEQDICW